MGEIRCLVFMKGINYLRMSRIQKSREVRIMIRIRLIVQGLGALNWGISFIILAQVNLKSISWDNPLSLFTLLMELGMFLLNRLSRCQNAFIVKSTDSKVKSNDNPFFMSNKSQNCNTKSSDIKSKSSKSRTILSIF